jgi:chromosome segregation ATPase
MDIVQTMGTVDVNGALETSELTEGFLAPDSVARLAERVARMAARLEAATFERDLSNCVQARLAESYQGLLDREDDVLQDALSQKERLEQELHALRQQLSQAEAGRQQLQNSQSQVWAELSAARQRLSHAEAERLRLSAYTDSLKHSLDTVLNSKAWRLAQSLLGVVGRRWKI